MKKILESCKSLHFAYVDMNNYGDLTQILEKYESQEKIDRPVIARKWYDNIYLVNGIFDNPKYKVEEKFTNGYHIVEINGKVEDQILLSGDSKYSNKIKINIDYKNITCYQY